MTGTPLGERLRHRLLVAGRRAEVAGHGVAEPADVAHRDGVVEVQLGALLVDALLAAGTGAQPLAAVSPGSRLIMRNDRKVTASSTTTSWTSFFRTNRIGGPDRRGEVWRDGRQRAVTTATPGGTLRTCCHHVNNPSGGSVRARPATPGPRRRRDHGGAGVVGADRARPGRAPRRSWSSSAGAAGSAATPGAA